LKEEDIMQDRTKRMFVVAGLGFLLSSAMMTASHADTGIVRVVFTKGGFIIGAGGGRGILTFRNRNYPFRVSGMSFGATIGASTTKFVGKALNMQKPSDLAGSYATLGAGGALAAGAGGVQLQNGQTGVILQLTGAKVGVELSAAVGGVQIAME
jgi:lipid-binding SYLF domain-containing protein